MSTPRKKIIQLKPKTKPRPKPPKLEGLEQCPQVDIDDHPRTQVMQSLEALHVVNNVTPVLFTRQNVVVRLRRDLTEQRQVWLEALNKDGWCDALIQHVDFVKNVKGRWVPKYPMTSMIQALQGRTEYPFPAISRVVHAPFFTKDGTLVASEGFHAPARIYLALSTDLRDLPRIPTTPTTTEVKKAREIIHYPIRQFPYKEKAGASYAHTVALMLLPFVRPLIDGHVPIHTVKAPMERTGKGKLVNCACWPGLGHDVPVMPEVAGDKDELRKRLTAIIIDGAPLAFFDNINEVVRGGPLATILTARTWSDRILGKSQLVNLPVETSWVVAGNNLQFSKELLLRALFINLDAAMAQPWSRIFEEPKDPEGYMRQHRAELVWACLTLVQHWLAQGRPAPPSSGPLLGGFEAYTLVMGGVLAAAEIPGFMGNLEELHETEDYDVDTWRPFLALWWAKHQDNAISTMTICQVDNEFFEKPLENQRSRATRFGLLMKRIADRVYELGTGHDERRFTVQVTLSKTYKDERGKWQSGGYFLKILEGTPGEGRETKKRRKW